MKRFSIKTSTLGLAFLCMSLQAAAAVSAEEAAKLKADLTPLGAEKAGNAAGTIPAWTGGFTKPPAGYKNGQPRPDPFASEKPLYTITAANLDKYADKLAESQIAMLKKYPDYSISVYPTQRTAAAPQWVYDNTFKNATNAKLTENGSVQGAYGGIPFPIPKSGAEAMWNHLLRWRGESMQGRNQIYVVGSDGAKVLVFGGGAEFQFPYYFKEGSLSNFGGEYALIYQFTEAPAFKAGETVLLRDSVEMTKGSGGRQAWQYLVGQRRVRRAPTLAYDSPNPTSSGIEFFDEPFLFMGSLDRYDWKLVGKKEMLIPYNDNGLMLRTDDELLKPNHMESKYTRWELHRVWVVEAALAPGKRHVLPKRRFYLDEDTWAAVLSEGYDSQGQLWHFGIGYPTLAYELPGVTMEAWVTHDFLKGSYASSLFNASKMPFVQVPHFPDSNFTPESMAARGVR